MLLDRVELAWDVFKRESANPNMDPECAFNVADAFIAEAERQQSGEKHSEWTPDKCPACGKKRIDPQPVEAETKRRIYVDNIGHIHMVNRSRSGWYLQGHWNEHNRFIPDNEVSCFYENAIQLSLDTEAKEQNWQEIKESTDENK